VFCGGAEIRVSYDPGKDKRTPSPITDPKDITLFNAVWAQSVSTNKKLEGSLPGNPFIDNSPLLPDPNMVPPAAGYQYVGSGFYDKPARDANATFIADSFIATIDTQSRDLTVYGGIEWGFSVSGDRGTGPVAVPGPVAGAGLPGLTLVIGCLVRWGRRKRKAEAAAV
jgi:hypothetical protein